MWARAQALPGVELVDDLEECEVFISVLYDTLITEEFIDGRLACYNFHPGVLPEYRGSGAFSWSILNKEAYTGITLHEIDMGIDSGPVIDLRRIPILSNDTAGSLFKRAEEKIFTMFEQWFMRLATGEIRGVPQTSKGHIYYRKDLDVAKDITHIVRAFTFPGKESCYYVKDGKKIYLL